MMGKLPQMVLSDLYFTMPRIGSRTSVVELSAFMPM